MRLYPTLLPLSFLFAAGCGGHATGADGGSPQPEPQQPGCGGCACGAPQVPSGSASPAMACAIAGSDTFGTTQCDTFCAGINENHAGAYFCTLPADYLSAYQAANADAGAPSGDAVDAGPTCPAWTENVVVECGSVCLGRRTEGIEDPARSGAPSLGEIFAERAYLEEASVHAFERLERELRAHGAPGELLREVRRARRDEVRHTAMMARLARRYGGTEEAPRTVRQMPVRSLLRIAVENAVEGCVRETYGALVGLVEAQRSVDGDVRRVMNQVAKDECRHAELAFAIERWIEPRLSHEEREAVRVARDEAIASLAKEGVPPLVSALQRHVWGAAA